MKARMIIGGVLDETGVQPLADALAEADLWVCNIDEDDDNGDDPHADEEWSQDNPEWWWADWIKHRSAKERQLVLTVEDSHYDYNHFPLDSTDAFELVAAACEQQGLFYRIITPGGECKQTDFLVDRRVETLAPSGQYKGYANMAASAPSLAVTEKLLQDPIALMQAAQHAWMAASWPIPKLQLLVYA